MASVAFVTKSASTYLDGRRVRLKRNDVWDANDPVVKAFPENFSDVPADPADLHRSVDPVVEQATAAPGEKRNTRAAKPKE